MGACVVNGVELATEVEQGDALPFDLHAFGGLIRDLRFLCYWDKLSVSQASNGIGG